MRYMIGNVGKSICGVNTNPCFLTGIRKDKEGVMMSMDETTKKRYEAWKRQKILKLIVPLVALLFITFVALFFGLRSCNSAGVNEYTETLTELEPPVDETEPSEADEPTETDSEDPTSLTNGDAAREPIIFCGTADPDEATVLTTEESLSYLALVNRCYRLASDFSPHDLTIVNVPSVNAPEDGYGGHRLREAAAHALEALFSEAESVGLNLFMSSGYRDFNLQTFFYERQIQNQGGDVEAARRISAVPGHSEHQLGLGVDLTTPELQVLGWLHPDFSATPEGVWVRDNAHRFGFIVSFPYGREADVAIIYEPWHIRYVGVEAAIEIFNNDQILEEYLWYSNN